MQPRDFDERVAAGWESRSTVTQHGLQLRQPGSFTRLDRPTRIARPSTGLLVHSSSESARDVPDNPYIKNREDVARGGCAYVNRFPLHWNLASVRAPTTPGWALPSRDRSTHRHE